MSKEMGKNEEVGFKAYYEQLSDEKKVEVRDQFMQESGCALPTFYNKKANPKRFTKPERVILSRIMKSNPIT